MEVIACGISWSELKSAWVINKKASVTHFYGMTLAITFFQNFQDKPRNFSGVFTKAFPQPPCLLFFLEQITDRQIDLLFWVLRYPAHSTGLELLPEPPQNKICYILHPKYMSFSCFPTICSSAI